MDYRNDLNWCLHLDKIELAYNSRVRKSLDNMCPLEIVMEKEKEEKLKRYYARKVIAFEKKYGKKKDAFEVGDYVRPVNDKSLFSKGYEPEFSEEVYQIIRKKPTTPAVYYLSGGQTQRPYYSAELSKVAAPETQKKSLFIAKTRNLKTTLRSGKKISKEQEYYLQDRNQKEKGVWIKEAEKKALEKRGLLS